MKEKDKKKIYKAHVNKSTQEVQALQEHSKNVGKLCRDFAVPELKEILDVIGLTHDLGKYQSSFQKKIDGANLKVEHSICGAITVKEKYPDPIGVLMEYCIAGHHTGIPDGGFPNDTSEMTTLNGRLKRQTEDYSAYKKELDISELDNTDFLQFLLKDNGKNVEALIDKFAFLTRYCFSCLVDADSLDTAEFCGESQERVLKADFSACLNKLNKKLTSFKSETSLQKARTMLQQQVFEKKSDDAEIYLMNMPTGSGKTLCSAKFALERAVRKQKKRIVYIIPYNSIIDQTAEVFEKLFGEDVEILRHQSTFSYEEDADEEYRQATRSAAENWDAPFIITTAVQFFESIYSNKRGKLRKLHNMSDSILVFDEAHLMPGNYLQSCLQAIAYITKYLNSEAIFLTATMPDFQKLLHQYALPNSKIVPLIEDTSMFSAFQKCSYRYPGVLEREELVAKTASFPSSLIITNTRPAARSIYKECGGKKYHLSTYMTPYDRKKILQDIRAELSKLEEDFPNGENVPENRRVTIVSTSLIEAGVDLDVHSVFRELSGLDSILQAGGRCNREGKRVDAKVFVFELESETKRASQDERRNLTKGLLKKYSDISCPESIREYYEQLFFIKKEEIRENTMSQRCKDIHSIPFKKYAEDFNPIDSKMESVVVPRDESSRKMIEALQYTGVGNIRKLQPYVCSLYQRELDDLIRQHVVADFGTGIYCLTNEDYYDEKMGVLFEAKDYIID